MYLIVNSFENALGTPESFLKKMAEISADLAEALENALPSMTWLHGLWDFLYNLADWFSFDIELVNIGVTCQAAQGTFDSAASRSV